MELIGTFTILSILCAVVLYHQRSEHRQETSAKFSRFQKNFIVVYVFAHAADQLQSPYLYSLYENYGYSRKVVRQLLVTAFLSQAVLGTAAGVYADALGRRKSCVAYCILAAAASLSIFFHHGYIAVLGRICAGAASTLLAVSFESWMVEEHNKLSFRSEWLSVTFTRSVFFTSMSAIACSIAATCLVHWMGAGFSSPSLVAFLLLLLAAAVVGSTWSENFGIARQDKVARSLWALARHVIQDQRLLLLGIVQSLFDSSIHAFLLLWSPTLEGDGRLVPLGMLHGCFMLCLSLGSLLAAMLLGPKYNYSPEGYLGVVCLLAAAGLAVPLITEDVKALQLSFFLFQFSVGIYLPTIARLRSMYIPDDTRCSIMSLFRVPLCVIITIILIKAESLPNTLIFFCGTIWLLLAALCQCLLLNLSRRSVSVEQEQQGMMI